MARRPKNRPNDQSEEILLSEAYRTLCDSITDSHPDIDIAKLTKAIVWANQKASLVKPSLIEIVPDAFTVAQRITDRGGMSLDGYMAHFLYYAVRPDHDGKIDEALLHEVRGLFGKKTYDIVRDLLRVVPVEFLPHQDFTQRTDEQEEERKSKFHLMALWMTRSLESLIIRIAVWSVVMDSLNPATPRADRKWASEKTLNTIIPLARAAGLHSYVDGIGASWLRVVEPEWFNAIREFKGRFRKKYIPANPDMSHGMTGEKLLNLIKEEVSVAVCQETGLSFADFEVKWREKSDFAIFESLQRENVTDLGKAETFLRNDMEGLRIVVKTRNSLPDYESFEHYRRTICLKIHNKLIARAGSKHRSTETWKLIEGENRNKDWISTPRDNGYTAAQTTIRIRGIRVEIQTTDEEWDYNNQFGSGRHDAYAKVKESKLITKTPPSKRPKKGIATDMLVKPIKAITTPLHAWHNAVRGVGKKITYTAAITDADDIVDLVGPMCVAEFALLSAGPEMAARCIGAKIERADPLHRSRNQRTFALNTELQNGDRATLVLSEQPVRDTVEQRETFLRLFRNPKHRQLMVEYFKNSRGNNPVNSL